MYKRQAEKWDRRGTLPLGLAPAPDAVDLLPCLPRPAALRRLDGQSLDRLGVRGPGAELTGPPQPGLAALGLAGGAIAGFCLALAPELGGRPVEKEIHGLDLGTRAVWAGADLLGPIARRLPGWMWLAPVLALPGLPGLLNRVYLRWAAWRFRRTGRQPFA